MIVLLLLSLTVRAQRMLPKQKGIEANFGLLFTSDSQYYFVNTGIIIHTKKGNYHSYTLEYSRDNIPYRNTEVRIESYTAEAGYSLNLIANRTRNLMINSSLSATAGYEEINKGELLLYDGARLINQSSFVYGVSGKLSMEIYLSDRIVLLTSGKLQHLWNTSLSPLRCSVGIGIRFNL